MFFIFLTIFLDILFCINTNGKPVPIPETIKNRTVLSDFKKPPELGKWFAITALVRNSVLYYSNEYNGLTLCKIRQLKKLGYEPILVRFMYTKLFSIMVQKLLIVICHGYLLRLADALLLVVYAASSRTKSASSQEASSIHYLLYPIRVCSFLHDKNYILSWFFSYGHGLRCNYILARGYGIWIINSYIFVK